MGAFCFKARYSRHYQQTTTAQLLKQQTGEIDSGIIIVLGQNQVVFYSEDDGLSVVASLKRLARFLQMIADAVGVQVQLVGNLLSFQPGCQQTQDF